MGSPGSPTRHPHPSAPLTEQAPSLSLGWEMVSPVGATLAQNGWDVLMTSLQNSPQGYQGFVGTCPARWQGSCGRSCGPQCQGRAWCVGVTEALASLLPHAAPYCLASLAAACLRL